MPQLLQCHIPRLKTCIHHDYTHSDLQRGVIRRAFDDAVQNFYEALDESVKLRVLSLPQKEYILYSVTVFCHLDAIRTSAVEGARIAILFSGGIDSTVLALLADRYRLSVGWSKILIRRFRHIPISEPIDLLNVAFENPRKLRAQKANNRSRRNHKNSFIPEDDNNVLEFDTVPDRMSGLEELEELKGLSPERTWNFV